jgi:two-component system, OmpR family, sensor histidine kinase KdpD
VSALAPRRVSAGRIALVVVSVPAIATAAALAVPGEGPLAATALLMMAVVVASIVGGWVAGVGAAVVAFLALNFFFTVPRRTFRVGEAQDLIALLVFLSVALVVGALVARALRERDRAARRERERRVLTELGSRMVGGEPLPHALEGLARSVVDLFGLARCTIEVRQPDGIRRAEAGDPELLERDGRSDGARPPAAVIGLSAGATELGTLTVVERPGGRRLDDEDRRLLRAIAGQAALAVERARLDAEVRDALLESEANRLRAALFASVTHDLRTPLASITAAATSLLEDEAAHSADQRRELLATVAEEAERLDRVVGNIIDLARIRSGTLSLERQLVPLDEVVDAVLARLRPVLGSFRVRTIIRPDLPMLSVDPIQLDQVLTNLLENAARYSPPGGEILVSATRWRSRAVVRVSDRGPGIPPEERERVFDEFLSGDDGGRVGLGLSIARAVVQAHGGRMWIEPSPGGGATVAFELPLDREPSPADRTPEGSG